MAFFRKKARENDLLEVLEGGVGLQRLGNGLSSFWSKVVGLKTAQKEGGRKMLEKCAFQIIIHLGYKMRMAFFKKRGGRKTYSRFWRAELVSSALAIACPASASSWLSARLQEGS